MLRPDPTTIAHTTTEDTAPAARSEAVVVTVLYLDDPSRIGEQAVLAGIDAGLEARLSRVEGHFGHPGGPRRPLADPRISRTPLRLQSVEGNLRLQFDPARVSVELEGQPVPSGTHIPADALTAGVVVGINRRVLLHVRRRKPPLARRFEGFVGCSPELDRLQENISAAAEADVTVLVRGPTGTGKELVARALHHRSQRSGPFVGVNVATLQEGTAMGELFGHVRGAFTGATGNRKGWFREADHGTLFLDEVGELATAQQAALLRVLDDGVVVPVGGTAVRSHARVVAATDAVLERLVEDGQLRAPLFHRLAGCTLWTTPLALRREDIPVLFTHFVRAERPSADLPAWFTRALILRMLDYPWPGNVRELRNAAREAVLFDRADRVAVASPHSEPVAPTPVVVPVSAHEAPLDDQALARVLEAHAWEVAPSARALGIAKNTLVARIQKSNTLVRSADLDAPTSRAALAASAGSIPAAARRLRVSARALKGRMRQLDLPPAG